MYKSLDFGSSFNRGASHFNNSNRPNNFGRFSKHKKFRGNNFHQNSGGQRHKSQLSSRDSHLFIKQSKEIIREVDQITHNSFEDFNLTTPLLANITHKGFTTPTPIQDKTIQPILDNRDLIGVANTGTGKTAAFLIPIIEKIFKDRNQKALIIAPTRELVNQIQADLKSLTHNMTIYSTLITGGANINRQIHEIRRNPHVVIGTPGRLKDLIKQNILDLSDFSIFVLDEVDLMVDIGFINDVKFFISYLPAKRQSLFFSATISPKVQDILKNFVKDPVTVSVKKQDTAEGIDQDVIKITDRSKKLDTLHDLLISDGFDKVLIFGRTKYGVEKLNKDLSFRGFSVGAIHGNKKLGQRLRTLESFKRNEIKILLATDVASRGLDIDNVTHVINYEIPDTYDDYIHRIGRTGRADKKGIALTFVDA